ncbi:MAG: radical SAM protein [Archaeoglobaceae archaeon]|nr:radical SAM protein [Archaeoglobaceae archaeon]MCX8152007.1 radical SAM protein [Archaeoglobaceae archaeon]MDW8013396.1 radical SAM protein [Archaeoglobaceae archaeon]
MLKAKVYVHLKVVRPFDPWRSKLCTCKEKFSFNPYTGCSHGCTYCYATYIPKFYELREKRNLFRSLESDLEKIPENSVISMSNSSDPYPPVEKEREITRRCLEIIKDYNFKLLILTKSDIVVRDLDVLSEMRAVVSITITGCDHLEPLAPKTEKRIEAFKKVKDSVPAVLRFDPIIPRLNEDKFWIIEKCDPDHLVTSTLKLKKKVENSERVGKYYYLPRDLRFNLLKKVEDFCRSLGISCAFCREGFDFKAKSCDGQHLFNL